MNDIKTNLLSRFVLVAVAMQRSIARNVCVAYVISWCFQFLFVMFFVHSMGEGQHGTILRSQSVIVYVIIVIVYVIQKWHIRQHV